MPEVVSISIELEESANGVDATGWLELSGKQYRATAHAPEHRKDHRVSHDLAIARAMRGLEIEVMEWVHEHIDRCIVDQ